MRYTPFQPPDRFNHLLENYQPQPRQKYAPQRLPCRNHVQCPSRITCTYQDPITSLSNNWIFLIISIYLSIYLCTYSQVIVCLFVCYFFTAKLEHLKAQILGGGISAYGQGFKVPNVGLDIRFETKAAIKWILRTGVRQCCRRTAGKR